MRIAIVSTLFGADFGGSEVLWVEFAIHAKKKGHDVIAFIYEKKSVHPAFKKLEANGIPIIYRKLNQLPTRKIQKLKYHFKRKILGFNPYDIINSFHPDVLYINQAGSVDGASDQYLREYLYKTKLPYFINPHQVSEVGVKPIKDLLPHVQRIFNKAEGLIFVSKRNKEVLYKLWNINNPKIIFTVYPIALDSLEPIPYPDLKEEVHFATVAALNCEQKGQHLLMQIFGKEKWQKRKWVWNIYGTGPDEAKLKFLAKQNNIESRVHFKGFVTNIRNVWKYNHVHIFSTFSEGMPLAITETLVCSRPVVATDIGGISEWVKEDINGFIAKEPTLNCMEDALEKAWRNKENWAKMSMGINEHFKMQYNFNYLDDLLRFVTSRN